VGDIFDGGPFALCGRIFGVDLTMDELESPPLPEGPLVVAWRRYLASWSAGRRRDALAAVTEFVDLLERAGGPVSTAFAKWLCSLLFDGSGFWAGQWGGGLTLRGGVWQRPAIPGTGRRQRLPLGSGRSTKAAHPARGR
jgi:hypothetical protein